MNPKIDFLFQLKFYSIYGSKWELIIQNTRLLPSQLPTEIVDVRPSILWHGQLKGSTRNVKNHQQQKLMPKKEEGAVECCKRLEKCDFPATVEDAHEHTLHISQ